MKTDALETMVFDTLTHCLEEMSEELKSSFDPNDNKSIRLLQQFRSTLTAYKQWVKHTASPTRPTEKTPWQGSHAAMRCSEPAPNHEKKTDVPLSIDNLVFPVNEETAEIHRQLRQPSGLVMWPWAHQKSNQKSVDLTKWITSSQLKQYKIDKTTITFHKPFE